MNIERVLYGSNSLIYDFTDKTKLPCHIVGQAVLFQSDATNRSIVHAKTERNTIQVYLIPYYSKVN